MFSSDIDSISVEQWTIVMSQSFRALFIPKSFRVAIACMFLRGGPTACFDAVAQPRLYRWNKFKSPLERTFRGFSAPWERRMVNEFGNCTDDSNDDDFGCEEGTSPASVPDRKAGDDDDDDYNCGSDDSNGDDDEDPNEDPEKGVILKC